MHAFCMFYLYVLTRECLVQEKAGKVSEITGASSEPHVGFVPSGKFGFYNVHLTSLQMKQSETC